MREAGPIALRGDSRGTRDSYRGTGPSCRGAGAGSSRVRPGVMAPIHAALTTRRVDTDLLLRSGETLAAALALLCAASSTRGSPVAETCFHDSSWRAPRLRPALLRAQLRSLALGLERRAPHETRARVLAQPLLTVRSMQKSHPNPGAVLHPRTGRTLVCSESGGSCFCSQPDGAVRPAFARRGASPATPPESRIARKARIARRLLSLLGAAPPHDRLGDIGVLRRRRHRTSGSALTAPAATRHPGRSNWYGSWSGEHARVRSQAGRMPSDEPCGPGAGSAPAGAGGRRVGRVA